MSIFRKVTRFLGERVLFSRGNWEMPTYYSKLVVSSYVKCNSISPNCAITFHTEHDLCMFLMLSATTQFYQYTSYVMFITMFMKHLCIAINTVVTFEIAPAINMNATKLNK